MKEQLLAYQGEQRVGIIEWERNKDQLQFCYDESWRANPKAYPISLSMPLAIERHDHEKIEHFIWGLLPDNDTTLRKWGKKYGVSSRNAFKLLSFVGEDCAGAIQFIKPEREEFWFTQNQASETVEWLTQKEVNDRIELLKNDHSATRLKTDTGYFSLAGAQPKIALQFDPKEKRWGVPRGRTPTTHILKPATGEYDGFAENEHFCLCVARQLGFTNRRPQKGQDGYENRWLL